MKPLQAEQALLLVTAQAAASLAVAFATTAEIALTMSQVAAAVALEAL